jgi:hypothetical protein
LSAQPNLARNSVGGLAFRFSAQAADFKLCDKLGAKTSVFRRNEADLLEGRVTEQCLHQRAIEARSIAALGNDRLQHSFHPFQIGDLCPRVSQVSRR